MVRLLLYRRRWFTALLTLYVLLALAAGAAAIWATLGIVNLNVSTATLEMTWATAGTNDDGILGTYPGETTNDPTGPEPAPGRLGSNLASCTVAVGADPAELDLTLLKGFPPYTCTVKAGAHNGGELPVKLQSWALTGMDSSVTADLIAPACGTAVAVSYDSDVEFYVTIADTSTPGTSYLGTFDLTWIESNAYDPLLCP